jgi:hypothetical protein
MQLWSGKADSIPSSGEELRAILLKDGRPNLPCSSGRQRIFTGILNYPATAQGAPVGNSRIGRRWGMEALKERFFRVEP